MYEIMKSLMACVEKIGSIEEAELRKKDEYFEAGVKIKGTTTAGEKFCVEFEISK